MLRNQLRQLEFLCKFAILSCAFLSSSLVRAASAAAVTAAVTAANPVHALRVKGPLSARNANYQIRARLDEPNHRITAQGTLTWRNLERGAADRLVFHLYQNAFKNRASNFIFEAGAQLRGEGMPEHGYGAIDVSMLKVNGKDARKDAVLDDTLLSVALQEPIGPSATVEVELAWSVDLPHAFARSGHEGSYHAVTQWFPKIGVFECDPSCGWRAHQYHGITEFFADYGVYDVALDVPEKTVVGASGVLVGEEQREPGRRILRYHAEDVHDFAFFSDPRFLEFTERIDDGNGIVDVRLLTRPGHEPYNQRHFDATRHALLEAERRLGIYPYANITVVIPPWAARGSGGMEYPTLFASEPLPLPWGVHEMEAITAHEFLHQFFYGILGSDEVEEAWLDEGLNETISTWTMDRMFGRRCSGIDLPGLCISSIDEEWLGYRLATRHVPVSFRGFLLPREVYSPVTYNQTAVAMRTLERYLGDARMADGLRRYAERFRFRHPKKADFTAAMSEGAREDLSWFFSQALDSTRAADYRLLAVETRPYELAQGLWDCPPRPLERSALDTSDPVDAVRDLARRALYDESAAAACRAGAEKSARATPRQNGRYEWTLDPNRPPSLHDSQVVVQRRGEFRFPIVIAATFADGSSERVTWSLAEQDESPESRIKTLYFPRRKSPLVRAEVDPEQIFLLDENRLNNGLSVEPRPRPWARLYLTLVGALHTLFDLVGV